VVLVRDKAVVLAQGKVAVLVRDKAVVLAQGKVAVFVQGKAAALAQDKEVVLVRVKAAVLVQDKELVLAQDKEVVLVRVKAAVMVQDKELVLVQDNTAMLVQVKAVVLVLVLAASLVLDKAVSVQAALAKDKAAAVEAPAVEAPAVEAPAVEAPIEEFPALGVAVVPAAGGSEPKGNRCCFMRRLRLTRLVFPPTRIPQRWKKSFPERSRRCKDCMTLRERLTTQTPNHHCSRPLWRRQKRMTLTWLLAGAGAAPKDLQKRVGEERVCLEKLPRRKIACSEVPSIKFLI
jgi:hypothetical protein